MGGSGSPEVPEPIMATAKLGRLRLQARFVILSSVIINTNLFCIIFILIILSEFLLNSIRLFFFSCLKDAAGVALKKAAPALGCDRPKIRHRLWSLPKNGGSGSATLVL